MAILKGKKGGSKKTTIKTQKKGSSDSNNSTKKGKKRLSYMADVFDESVPGAVVETMISNNDFMYTVGDVRKFMAFALDTESIGGISKKTVNDKAKGGFINLIKSSTIKIYMTEELAEAGILLFIPTKETIIGMSEYSILANAEYTLVTLDETLNIDYHDSKLVAFDSFNIMDGNYPFDVSRRNALLDKFNIKYDTPLVDDEVGDFLEDIDEDSSEVYDASFDDDSRESDIEQFENTLNDQYNAAFADDEESFEDDSQFEDEEDVYDDGFMDETDGDGDEVTHDEPEPEQKLVYDDELFDEVVFNFNEDGLKIEVDVTNFELTYGKSLLKYDPFDTSRDNERWINDYLNEISLEANNTLKTESQNNYSVLKSSYLKTMGEAVQLIKMRASIDGDTEFAEEFAEINNDYNSLLDETDGKIEHSINIEKKRYDEEVEEIGELAKQEAMRSHRAMNDAQHNRKLEKIRNDLIYKANENRVRRLKSLDGKRQVFVNASIAEASAIALTNLNDIYLQMKTSENELVEKLNDKLDHYAQTNQATDERIYATRKLELETKDEINNLKRNHTIAIDKIKAEFNSSITAVKQQHDTSIRVLESQYKNESKIKESKIESLSSELTHEQSEVKNLIQAVESVKKQKDEEYRSQIANAEERANYANKKLDDEVRYARGKQFILFAVVILVALVAGLAGITIGNSNGRASAMTEMNANNNGGNNIYLPGVYGADATQQEQEQSQPSATDEDTLSEVASSEADTETVSE